MARVKTKAHRQLSRLAAAAEAATQRTPSAVLEAFAPGEGLVADLAALLRLERIASPLVTGGTVRLSDILTAYLVISDWPRVEAAWRKQRLPELLDEWAADRPAKEINLLAEIVRAAIDAAMAPVAQAADSGPSAEKKSLPVADGGSPSLSSSATATASSPPKS